MKNYSDTDILHVVANIRKTVFGLYNVIRYNQKRSLGEFISESTAEHIYSSLFIAELFFSEEGFDLEDYPKMVRMLITHDLHESVSGDTLEHNQTIGEDIKEINVLKVIKNTLPKTMGDIVELYKEKENGLSRLGKFVHAIDKIQSMFWFFTDDGIRMLKSVNTNEQIIFNQGKRLRIFSEFPTIKRFANIMFDDMKKRGVLD